MFTSVNVQRAPIERERILQGRFHQLRCPRCLVLFHYEGRFGYLDTDRRQWVGVFPRAEQARWELCEEMARAGFWQASGRAPPWWLDLALDTQVRVVFGVDRLVEKLIAWEHGLDDAVLALLALGLRDEHPGDLRLDGVDDDWLWMRGDDGGVRVPRERYAVLASQRPVLADRYPRLFRGAWVDVDRLAAGSGAPTTAPRW